MTHSVTGDVAEWVPDSLFLAALEPACGMTRLYGRHPPGPYFFAFFFTGLSAFALAAALETGFLAAASLPSCFT